MFPAPKARCLEQGFLYYLFLYQHRTKRCFINAS